eukprot:3599347-Amphidinium_carterae.2
MAQAVPHVRVSWRQPHERVKPAESRTWISVAAAFPSACWTAQRIRKSQLAARRAPWYLNRAQRTCFQGRPRQGWMKFTHLGNQSSLCSDRRSCCNVLISALAVRPLGTGQYWESFRVIHGLLNLRCATRYEAFRPQRRGHLRVLMVSSGIHGYYRQEHSASS